MNRSMNRGWLLICYTGFFALYFCDTQGNEGYEPFASPIFVELNLAEEYILQRNANWVDRWRKTSG